MASWMVHLRLAEGLLELIEGLDPGYFAIGSVAPDSGIPDENWENFDPPPEVLHFAAPGDKTRRLADLVFYRQHISPLKGEAVDPERISFLLGYFFHLVTDNLWDEQIARPASERFAAEFEADAKFIWQVKRDWYGLDFEYAREHPQGIFWQAFLESEYKEDFLAFLPREAVAQRIEYIKAFYQRRDDRIEEWYVRRPDLYLTKAEMDAFVEAATGRLYRVYRYLWHERVEAPEMASALGLEVG